MHQPGIPMNAVVGMVRRWKKGDKLFPALCVYGKDSGNQPKPLALMVVSIHSASLKYMEKLTMTHAENSSHARANG